ncbi:hypothetical protein OESDEN_22521 [Oesophagostomum dentatum]|uniref:Uncharacterized protein n=1 Tax=Oesophagostomum dentatum TaxID=61180 RepID=A0A0B1RYT3_OESDE|nr:hypothetical protein OESDEN_22521 [Oesophagostomum dentatum]
MFQSIGSVNRRLCDYEDERNAIGDDMTANERNGEYLLSIIEKHDPSLANKVRRHLDHFKELFRFEMKLRCLMAKVVEHIRNGGDQTDALLEESRLRRRLADVNFLRLTYARRERDLECAMVRSGFLYTLTLLNGDDITYGISGLLVENDNSSSLPRPLPLQLYTIPIHFSTTSSCATVF